MKGFRISQIDTADGALPVYSRRDFYTIYLLTGPRQVVGTGQAVELNDTCLVIGNPPGMAAERGAVARQTGYACRFTEAFFKDNGAVVSPAHWSLFNDHVTRAFSLREEQAAYFTELFQKMLAEHQTTYLFKPDLMRTYLQLIIHEALRLPAPPRFFRCYYRRPGTAGELGCSWRRQQRRPA